MPTPLYSLPRLEQGDTPSPAPAIAAEPPSGSLPRTNSRRRAAAGASGAAVDGAEEPSHKKQRRAKVLPPHGGTTSAANLQQLPPEDVDVGRGGDDLVSPLCQDALPRRTNDALMEAVVKVFCTHSEPNFSLPWQRKRQYSSSGSGFAIEGRRLLTNAHCVDHATQVRAQGPAAAAWASRLHTPCCTESAPASMLLVLAGQGQAARQRPEVCGSGAGYRHGVRHCHAHG